jgi:hypothetical protein
VELAPFSLYADGIAVTIAPRGELLKGNGAFAFDTAPRAQLEFGLQQDGLRTAATVDTYKEFLHNGLRGHILPLDQDTSTELYLQYEDDHGSHVEWKWTGVRFDLPWWRRGSTISHVLAIALLTVFLLLSRGAGRASRLLRILPATLVSLLAAGGKVLDEVTATIPFDPNILCIDIIFAMPVLTVIACLHAGAFQLLASVAPFRGLAALALLHLPGVRRRVFASYINELVAQRELARAEDIGAEHYVALPAHFRPTVEGEAPIVAEPVERVTNRLTMSPPPRLLIQAPGGRGKSALMRAVVARLVARHQADPMTPIPVVCRLDGDDWPAMMQAALGHHTPSESTAQQLLEAGAFAFVADGFSESAVTPLSLDRFARSDAGHRTPIVLASRPDRALEDIVVGLPGGAIVEPLPLADPEPLCTFVATYCEAKGALERVDDVLASVRRAVRGPDQMFAPVLVRFAVNVATRSDSIVDIYDKALIAAVKRRPDETDVTLSERLASLVATASRIARRSYWDGHRRAFRVDEARDRAACAELKAAGILVNASPRPKGILPGDYVRFIHDSMQTYCAALALVDDPEFERGATLRRAAGEPRFCRDASDLFGYTCTEIFGMVVAILAERDTAALICALDEDVRHWAAILDAWMPRQKVIDALPPWVRARIRGGGTKDSARLDVARADFMRGVSTEPLVREALNTLADDERIPVLASLYSVLAPDGWAFDTWPNAEGAPRTSYVPAAILFRDPP